MTEKEFEAFQDSISDRKKLLLPYEHFVKEKLTLYRDTSAAQMHDWLKEHYDDFPKVNQKTVSQYCTLAKMLPEMPSMVLKSVILPTDVTIQVRRSKKGGVRTPLRVFNPLLDDHGWTTSGRIFTSGRERMSGLPYFFLKRRSFIVLYL